MSQVADIVIRNASIVDGTGRPAFHGDVAIRDGRITGVGKVSGYGLEEIDAAGKLVTPGFIDIHTHYDGQVMWSSSLSPSNLHGVTTVVMGNCGVGFAPVRPAHRDGLIDLMEGVEDIPGVALAEGLDWSWESFSEYMDRLDTRPHDVDICAQIPHAPLRVYVMGDRALNLEAASKEDRLQMRALVKDAIVAGAFGVSTSQSRNHKAANGSPMPSYKSAKEELIELAKGLQDAGRGVMQFAMDFDKDGIDDDFDILQDLCEKTDVPISFTVVERHDNPSGWKRIVERTETAVNQGRRMKMQVAARPIGVLLGLQSSRNVFSKCPTFQGINHHPLEKKIELLKKSAIREKIISEFRQPCDDALAVRLSNLSGIYMLGEAPNYDPGSGQSISALAASQGMDEVEFAYDLQLANDGKTLLYSPFANYAHANLDACQEMVQHPHSLLSLGDGGAHVGLITDSSSTTFMLTHWVKQQGLPLEWAVQKLTSLPAEMMGLKDRGVIKQGMKADLNIIDLDRLEICFPYVVSDLPAGGTRFTQDSDGYLATFLSGKCVVREGKPTGLLPGRLVRSHSLVGSNN